MQIRFPQGFQWGAASAAYPTEGAWKAGGKGESIWDRFTHTPGRVESGANGDNACESHARFATDRKLLQDLNCTSYRFSIAWTRIQPQGRGTPVRSGLDHYAQVIDDLLEAGIRPFPALYHWDLPQALQTRGGWANRDTAGRFADYAHHVANALGDRIEDWILLNEPNMFTRRGYAIGDHAPGLCDLDAFFRATHTANLAQGEAFRAVRASRSTARIGTALTFTPCEPWGDQEADAAACERFDRFTNQWQLEPALRGEYPDAFEGEVPYTRMGCQHGDLDRVRAELDFIGVHVAPSVRVRSVTQDPLGIGGEAVSVGEASKGPTGGPIGFKPQALREMLLRLTQAYDRPALEVTLSAGHFADGPDPSDGTIRDRRRIDLLRNTLEAISEAIQAGADVRSAHVWSLLDQFDWSKGYAPRSGLVYVDRDTRERTVKDSGAWYQRVAGENGFET